MKPKVAKSRRSLDGLVRPIGMAKMYLSESNAPYRMEIRPLKDGSRLWAYFYKGRKLVWNCNDGFAKEHFVTVPNTEITGSGPEKGTR